jgi:hypothetical protein
MASSRSLNNDRGEARKKIETRKQLKWWLFAVVCGDWSICAPAEEDEEDEEDEDEEEEEEEEEQRLTSHTKTSETIE